MIIVVCAAGEGTRLKDLTKGKPKLLLEINGKALLKRVLDSAVQKGIKKIIIVIGYQAELIKRAIGSKYNGVEIIYVFNEYYHTKGNMSSLWAVREYINDDLVFTPGDVIISKDNVKKILMSKHDASILVDTSEKAKQRDDELKISLVNGRIKEIKKKMDKNKVYGTAPGFYKLKLGTAKKIYKIIENHFLKGETDLPFNVPIEELCQIENVMPVIADGSFCMDIDTPGDLKRATEELKRIEG